jgi:undecaprenyl-diphosphatase
MDWRITHLLNQALVRHDAVEDAIVRIERWSPVLLAGLLVVAFLAARGRDGTRVRRGLVAAVPAAAAALVAAQVLSRLVDRPRPFVAHPAVHTFLAHAADPGLPSDHATGAFAVAVAVALRSIRWGAALLVLAFVIAAGRVAVGVHYPTDVLAGAALGAACAWLFAQGPAGRLTDRIAGRWPGPAGATRPQAARTPRRASA